MDIIHLLPDSVANQIAAGEVIQRPASCLKELVENSLDAGSSSIQIIAQDAGTTLLQVIDDGKGMSETDARMAFERHATSKIQSASDLFSLRTMGFRGEALASIAAISKVEVLTRRSEDTLGTRLEIEASHVVEQEPSAAPIGTSIKVKDLFYNVPARRRFLKSEATELRNLLTDFHRIALVYPHVHFLFAHNDEVLYDLPMQNTKQRIDSIFKHKNKNLSQQLVSVQSQTAIVNISGFIGTPESANKNAQQYLFVNGRYMKHPYFHKAIMTAYSGMLHAEQSPSYFIYFDINPEAIDVNIHPTKTEIKFADEQYIWQILLAAVREALGKFNLAPSLDFDRNGEIEIPSFDTSRSQPVDAPRISINTNYNPFKQSSSYRPTIPSPKDWEQLYNGEHITSPQLDLLESDTQRFPTRALQVQNKYLIGSFDEGLLFIDQHRAHICIQYQAFRKKITQQQGVKQQLLFPETLDLSTNDATLLLSVLEDLQFAGFEITQLSRLTFSIDAIPADISGQNAAQVLLNILQAIAADSISTAEQRVHNIALSLAQATAIRAGKTLSESEITSLLSDLFALAEYTYTPDGKRIVSILTYEELGKRF